MSPFHWVPDTPAPINPPPPLPNLTFKGVQIATPPANSPTVAQLQDANVGAVRAIAHWPRTPTELQSYLQPIADAGIYVILCVVQHVGNWTPNPSPPPAMLPGTARPDWIARINAIAAGTPAVDLYEIINEPPPTFPYDGVNGSNWSRFFMMAEEAAVILKNPPYNKRVILGAAENQQTNLLLAAANTRYGDTYVSASPSWHEFWDGVAVHTYSSSATAIVTKLNTSNARAPTRVGNNGASGDLRQNLPIYITEMSGATPGGNYGSGMVAGQGASFETTARGTSAQSITGTNFTLLTNTMPAGFPPSGQLFFRTMGGRDLRKINYNGRTGTPTTPGSFQNCNTWDVMAGEQIAGGESIEYEVPDGDGGRDTAQANYVTAVFPAIAARAAKSDLHVRFIGWFIWRDYGGHVGASPLNPFNWAELSGLSWWGPNSQANFSQDSVASPADTAVPPAQRRPAYTNFKNVNGGNPSWPLGA